MVRRAPCEVKQHSSRRKRNYKVFPQQRRAKRKQPKPVRGFRVCAFMYPYDHLNILWGFGQPTLDQVQKKLQSAYVEEDGWKASPKRVIVSYSKHNRLLGLLQSSMGHVKSCVKEARPLVKAKYTKTPIVNQYRKGKVKSTPVRGVKQYLKPYTDKLTEPYMGDVVPIEE